MNINVVKPYIPNIEKYESLISKVLESNNFTNNGPFVQLLEEKLKAFLDVENVVLVSNGTIALQLLYKALGIRKKVLTTPFSFLATMSSLKWEGIEPVFTDICDETFNLSPNLVNNDDLLDVEAILPVHVFGQPCFLEEFEFIAKENNVHLIYDAAHAFGVTKEGRSVLSYGKASTLSFHATKVFQTIEGGAIITNDTDLADKLRSLRSFGVVDIEGEKVFGINAKMSEVHAVMGISQLDVFEESVNRRKLIYHKYKNELNDRYIFQNLNMEVEWNYSYAPILFKSEKELNDKILSLNALGIYPRRYFMPSLDTLINSSNICNISRDTSSRILCLPLFADLSDNDVDRIIKILKE